MAGAKEWAVRHTGASWAPETKTHHELQPPIPHPTEDGPSPAALSSLSGMGMPGAEALGEKWGVFLGPK